MVKIEDITNQNLWWKLKEDWVNYDRDMIRFRKQSLQFKRKEIEFEQGNIYILRGPRRVGKTVYLKDCVGKLIAEAKKDPQQIMYFDCETLPRSRAQLNRLIKNFFDLSREYNQKFIFLDEITHIPEWEIELKSLQDTGYLKNTVVGVTGSLPSVIKEKAEMLPGRGVEGNDYLLKPITFRDFILTAYKLHPQYSQSETSTSLLNLLDILRKHTITLEEDVKSMRDIFNKIFPFIEEIRVLFELYLLTGGFPTVINSYAKSKQKNIDGRMYEEFCRWIEGDISKTGKRSALASEILRGVLERIGTRYSYTALTRGLESGIPHQTLMNYIDTLEDSFILHVLYAYDLSRKRPRMKADKKIYFSDPFIYHSMGSKTTGVPGFEYAKENLHNEEKISKLVEGVAAAHLVRTKEKPIMKEANTFLWFYYDAKKELDFVYRKNTKRYIGIEIKYKSEVEIKDLKEVAPIKEHILLTKSDFDIKDENRVVIPVSLFLSLLKTSEKNL